MAEENNEVTTETKPKVAESAEAVAAAETPASENTRDETPKKEAVSKTAPPLPENTHFIWGTGRRKSAIARVRIRPGSGKITINKRDMPDYFTTERDRQAVVSPLKVAGMLKSYDIWVNVGGGGYTGQAGAVMLGLARALARHIPEIEHDLRNKGLLTRDSRMKERKKPGQPGARKSFQFSKR